MNNRPRAGKIQQKIWIQWGIIGNLKMRNRNHFLWGNKLPASSQTLLHQRLGVGKWFLPLATGMLVALVDLSGRYWSASGCLWKLGLQECLLCRALGLQKAEMTMTANKNSSINHGAGGTKAPRETLSRWVGVYFWEMASRICQIAWDPGRISAKV